MLCPVPSPLPLVGGFVAGGSPAPTPAPSFDELSLFTVGTDGYYFDLRPGLSNARQVHDGTGGAPDNGDPIGRLIDLAAGVNSKPARHLLQSTSGQRPQAATLGGLACVDFAAVVGSSIGFSDDVFDGRVTKPGYFRAYILRRTGAPTGRHISSDNSRDWTLGSSGISTGLWIQDQEGGTARVGDTEPLLPALNVWELFTERFSPVTGESSIRRNGGTPVTGSTNGFNFPLGVRWGKPEFQGSPNVAVAAAIQINRLPSTAEENGLIADWLASIGL